MAENNNSNEETNSNEESNEVICPIRHDTFVPCEISELNPIIKHLEQNNTVNGQIAFPRGTLIDDGRLDLCKQSIGPEGTKKIAYALNHNTHVTSLMLGTDGLGNEGAKAVADLVSTNNTLKTVYLGCNLIDDKGAKELTDSLSKNKSVKGIWLKRNPIGFEGAKYVAELLKTNATIRTVDLVNTGIGLAGTRIIIESLLEHNHSVERIYLGGNGLDHRIAEDLARLLTTNKNIKFLLVNVNQLGNKGAEILAQALRENSTLLELGLASNGIDSKGTRALVDALLHHPSLYLLDLGYSRSTKILQGRGNNLKDQGAAAIAQLIEAVTPLREINIGNNNISPKGARKVLDALEKNTYLQKLILSRIPKYLRERRQQLIARNREQASEVYQPFYPDVEAIRSVYRAHSTNI